MSEDTPVIPTFSEGSALFQVKEGATEAMDTSEVMGTSQLDSNLM